MQLKIRIAQHEDLPILNHLYSEMDGEPPLPLIKLEQIFEEISTIPNYNIYLVEWEGNVVGTFGLLFAPTMIHRGFHKFAILDAVTVSPAYRNQGIGKAMMQEALKLSAAAGCYKITLSSNLKRDRAHAFYQSLGFEQHGWSFSLQVPEAKILG